MDKYESLLGSKTEIFDKMVKFLSRLQDLDLLRDGVVDCSFRLTYHKVNRIVEVS